MRRSPNLGVAVQQLANTNVPMKPGHLNRNDRMDDVKYYSEETLLHVWLITIRLYLFIFVPILC